MSAPCSAAKAPSAASTRATIRARNPRGSASRRAVASITTARATGRDDPAPSSSSSSDKVVTSSSPAHRRVALASLALVPIAGGASLLSAPRPARADPNGPFCDFTQTLPCDDYPTYERTASGLLYKEVRFGDGARVETGKEVVVDWDGYTFYLSHVVQARNLPKGGDFTGENPDAFLRFTPGADVPTVIPAFEECVRGMRVGGIRRIIVRPGPLSYPGSLTRRGGRFDEGIGPVPSSLSGKRALEFVLRNTANVDQSLLFDVEVIAVAGDETKRGLGRGPGRWADGVKGSLT